MTTLKKIVLFALEYVKQHKDFFKRRAINLDKIKGINFGFHLHRLSYHIIKTFQLNTNYSLSNEEV